MKPCKIWTKALNHAGYGVRNVKGRTRLVHRLAWEEAYGPIPRGLCVLHVVCDRPACYEPTHLRLGTRADNSRDMVFKNRAVRGLDVRGAKLSLEKVAEIRQIYWAHEATQTQLGARYGVTPGMISMLVNGKRQSYINGMEWRPPACRGIDATQIQGFPL